MNGYSVSKYLNISSRQDSEQAEVSDSFIYPSGFRKNEAILDLLSKKRLRNGVKRISCLKTLLLTKIK